ncbi:hypothetical protein IG631_06789 [Alternaria alternata]|nr:hypothetical protein IG631_06789 [Alternaria alternata]
MAEPLCAGPSGSRGSRCLIETTATSRQLGARDKFSSKPSTSKTPATYRAVRGTTTGQLTRGLSCITLVSPWARSISMNTQPKYHVSKPLNHPDALNGRDDGQILNDESRASG